MGKCSICGKVMDGSFGHGQHGKKHRREFAEETGYSKHTDYEIIKAYYKPENADNWAVEIVNQLKENNALPKNTDLTHFEPENTKEKQLREELAALEHRQWQYWTEYLVEESEHDIPEQLVEKWKSNWQEYETLSEEMKDKDREWADKAMKIIQKYIGEIQ